MSTGQYPWKNAKVEQSIDLIAADGRVFGRLGRVADWGGFIFERSDESQPYKFPKEKAAELAEAIEGFASRVDALPAGLESSAQPLNTGESLLRLVAPAAAYDVVARSDFDGIVVQLVLRYQRTGFDLVLRLQWGEADGVYFLSSTVGRQISAYLRADDPLSG